MVVKTNKKIECFSALVRLFANDNILHSMILRANTSLCYRSVSPGNVCGQAATPLTASRRWICRATQRSNTPRFCRTLAAIVSSVAAGHQTGMPQPTRVLLTNDDGPDSSFFQAWVKHVREVLKWNYIVCIPGQQQSFVSKSISHGPLQVTNVDENTMHINATPATCANLAIHTLVPDVDFVVSGPNVGHNVGRASVLSSGTLGAAMEASMAQRKAVAVSFPFNGWNSWTDDDIAVAVQTAGQVVTELWQEWQDGDVKADVFNVNVPLGFKTVDGTPVKPEVLRTTVDMQSQYSSLYKAVEGQDGAYEWGPKGLKPFDLPAPTAGGDVAAVKAGHVSISALNTGFIQPKM